MHLTSKLWSKRILVINSLYLKALKLVDGDSLGCLLLSSSASQASILGGNRRTEEQQSMMFFSYIIIVQFYSIGVLCYYRDWTLALGRAVANACITNAA